MRLIWKLAIVIVVALLLYPGWLAYQIWHQSRQDELHSAEAIIVLGAAQYDGDPSPVFQARLDQAAYLFNEDLSDTVIVTGGKQEGDRFTEAEAGERYLGTKGVPAENVLGETEGTTTLESMRNVAEMAEANGIESVLLVSDPLHSERIKRMADDLGFEETYASPASYVQLNRSRATKIQELVHEVGSLMAYELFDK
ncbi:MAG: YdcF family protein [Actinomycetota bacterium]